MKRIIAMLLVVTTLFTTFAINVSAATAEEFISEVALIYKDSVEDAKKAIEGTDWKLFEQDLNPKADYMFDDGVYLIYKTSTNVEDAITDLRVMDMYGGYSTSNYEKMLEASRAEYLAIVNDIRVAALEFKACYDAGDEMAKLAYRQMNYYRDVGESNMLMGDFMLNIPSDNALVTVMMEGNAFVVTNLISLLAVSLSGASGETFANRISAKYAIKDTLTDLEYYDSANALAVEFKELAARIKRYNTLSERYNLTDEEMSEDEFQFLTEYGAIVFMLEQIPYGNESLKDFIVRDGWTTKDLYPVVAALSKGQLALSETGAFITVLQYASPSKPIEELYKILEETEKELKDENGNIKVYDVYMGVDRSIFDGNFAFTTAAQRQQALTGMEWNADYYLKKKADDQVPYTAVKALVTSGLAVGLTPGVVQAVVINAIRTAGAISKEAGYAAAAKWYASGTIGKYMFGQSYGNGLFAYTGTKVFLAVGIGLLVAALGVMGVSIWYGYYNPDYTPIPDNLIDVRETDLGDKYVKYTAAKVFEDGKLSEKNADFNAYEGKEWVALYYTKDATAGNCLTPKFVYKDNDATIARRHQGISMFGETKAFNLNSHVYNDNAPGVYVTIRYSNTKKAAADLPNVVGSMFATGALYAVTLLVGAGAGVGGTLLIQTAKKKKKEQAAEEANA